MSKMTFIPGTTFVRSADDLPTSAQFYAVKLRNASTMAASSIAWCMGNIGATGKTIYVPSAELQVMFDGTGAATVLGIQLVKLTAGTAITGGTPVTHVPAKLRTAGATSVATVQYYDLTTTLAITNSVVAGVLGSVMCGRTTEAATLDASKFSIDLDFTMGGKTEGLELGANEWLAVRTLTTGVAGDTYIISIPTIER